MPRNKSFSPIYRNGIAPDFTGTCLSCQGQEPGRWHAYAPTSQVLLGTLTRSIYSMVADCTVSPDFTDIYWDTLRMEGHNRTAFYVCSKTWTVGIHRGDIAAPR